MTTKKCAGWRMPDWMEPYRGDIRNTGGNLVEVLMDTYLNDRRVLDTNLPLGVLSIAVVSQVELLTRLHETGRLGKEG